MCTAKDSPWSILVGSKEGPLVMLIKKDGAKEKEGKLNEAEKVEQKLELGSKQTMKREYWEWKKTWNMLIFAAAKWPQWGWMVWSKWPQHRLTRRRLRQESENLPGDQSWCPTCSLTFAMSNAPPSLRLTGSSGEENVAISVHQFGK